LNEIASVDRGFGDLGGREGIDMVFLPGFLRELFSVDCERNGREGRQGSQRVV
jgi:hypothetical protein